VFKNTLMRAVLNGLSVSCYDVFKNTLMCAVLNGLSVSCYDVFKNTLIFAILNGLTVAMICLKLSRCWSFEKRFKRYGVAVLLKLLI